MATYAAAALTMRKKLIISGLKNSGASAPETAKTLKEAGIINPEKQVKRLRESCWGVSSRIFDSQEHSLGTV